MGFYTNMILKPICDQIIYRQQNRKMLDIMTNYIKK